MLHLLPLPLLVLTVVLLIRAEFRSATQQVYIFKPASTLLVILVAGLTLLAPTANPAFALWVLAGLLLSLGGDVALMFTSSKAFLVGLVLFLLAHVVYAVGFTLFNGFHPGDLAVGLVLLILGISGPAWVA